MEVPIVAKIGARFCSCGRAGDIAPVDTKYMPVGWLDDDLEVHNLMRYWIHDIIMCTPKRLKFVIVENILLDIRKKKRLCDALLVKLKINSIVFLPDILMACIASGVSEGLVIDIGYENTIVAPVMDLRILENYIAISDVAAKWFASSACLEFEVDDGDEFIKEFKIQGAMEYRDKAIDEEKVTGFINKFTGESYEADMFDDNELPLIPLICKSVSKLPMDLKARLLRKIIIIGGISRVTGLKRYLINLIQRNYHNAMGIHALDIWQGCSIYTFHSLMQKYKCSMELSQEKFLNNGVVPDWHLSKFR